MLYYVYSKERRCLIMKRLVKQLIRAGYNASYNEEEDNVQVVDITEEGDYLEINKIDDSRKFLLVTDNQEEIVNRTEIMEVMESYT